MNVCTSCANGFFLANATTCSVGNIADCVVYTSSTSCSVCVDNKMPAVNRATCIAGTTIGCKTYSANAFCSVCNPGYTVDLSAGTCTGKIA